MNISIDANATFNVVGEIKPMYVRLEDENHELHTYKIEEIKQTKDEKFAGIQARIFYCNILVNDQMREIIIRYHFQSHRWALLSGK